MTLLLAFLIGSLAGLRSLTAPAATAWAVRLGWLKLERPLAIIGSGPSVVIFTALALLEIAADKWPKAPNRTAPPGLIARIATGGLSGACIAAGAGHAALSGAIFGAIGGIAGCFGGYLARKRLVEVLRVPDIYVALLEDVIAVAGSFWVVSRL